MAAASNQRIRRTILLLAIGVTLCLILVGKTAPAAEQIDQSNLPDWTGGWTHINPTAEGQATMWQTFRPACTKVIAVAIDILTNNPGQGDDVLTVEIAKDGDVLASAECSVADGFDGLLRFEFPEAVPLVPEQIYELKVRDTGKTRFGWKYGPNTYERGSRYVLAEERPGTDWFFQTYSNVEQATFKYSGGTGEPNDPYQIATAADLVALGEEPNDYDKHFILTADIDLDPNLPGGKVFDKAVIAPDINNAEDLFQGAPFSGVFDGEGHTISRLTINGADIVGLFGQMSGEIRDLGIVHVRIIASGDAVAGLVGRNSGNLIRCHSSGTVGALWMVGGLVGYNYGGTVTQCYSTVTVSGDGSVGGLVGQNGLTPKIGPIVSGSVSDCCSAGTVSGNFVTGGLVGFNSCGTVTHSYSTGLVQASFVGGLVGSILSGNIAACFWDTETSGQATSAGGTGKTTAEMQMAETFLEAGWDFVGETANGTEDIWWILEGKDYPRLWWELIPEN